MKAVADFKPGQKWISNAEPELGMGRVMSLQDRVVSVFFDMARKERTYARHQAPVTRERQWDNASWEGNRRAQLRASLKLTPRQRFEALV